MALIFGIAIKGSAQNVVFSPIGQLVADKGVTITISASVDTGDANKSKLFTGAFFCNDVYSSKTKTLELNHNLNGFRDSVLLNNKTLKKGTQSFFVNYNGEQSRGFSGLITDALKDNNVVNVTERIVFTVSDQEYKQFSDNLYSSMASGDSATIVGLIPPGLKGMICFDFLSADEYGGDVHQYQAMITKYQFASASTAADLGPMFKFIGAGAKTITGYLTTEWQFSPESFNGNISQLRSDAYTRQDKYKFASTIKDISSQLTVATLDEGRKYHRVIVFINR